MKLSPSLIPALISTAWAAAIPDTSDTSIKAFEDNHYDAVVVGGGPSGLAALSGLARVRRKVLLIDSGVYRNAATRHMHDVLGFDGVTPAYFRWAARKQIGFYDTIQMTNGTVVSITAPNASINSNTTTPYFTITTAFDGNSDATRNISARRVILGTGLRDLLSDTPGIREYWGSGLFWCPWCDGHEHADQPLGVIGPLSSVPGNAREMSTLNSDIIMFVNGTDTEDNRKALNASSPGWQSLLQYRNITIENRTISAVVRLRDGSGANNGTNATAAALPSVEEYDLFRVDFEQGPSIERAAFLLSVKNEQASWVGRDVGVALYGEGRMYTDSSLLTNIKGVYAIGDANLDNSTNVPHAMYTGKRAAVNCHLDLAKEEASKDIYIEQQNSTSSGPTKRSVPPTPLDPRALWNVVNGDLDDILFAGEYDQ